MGSVDGAAHDREPCVRPCLRDHAGGRAGGTTSCPGPPDGRGYGARHARAARGRHGMNATRSAWPDPAAPIVPDWMEHRGTLLSAEEDRKSVVQGTSVSVRVDLGGRRLHKKKKKNKK